MPQVLARAAKAVRVEPFVDAANRRASARESSGADYTGKPSDRSVDCRCS